MLTYVKSEIAKLYATFSFGGTPVDPTNLQITIYHGSDIVAGPTTMTKISIGYYFYEFTVPSNWDEDFYSAVKTGEINTVPYKNEETFKVVDSETVTTSDEPTGEDWTVGDVQEELVGVEYQNLDNINSIIVDYIPKASQEVDRRCNRNFKQITQTDYLDGNDTPNIYAPHTPINSVAQCVLLLTPSVEWYTFQAIALINTIMDINTQIATPATDDEYAAADLIVDCLSGRLNIPERVQYVGQSSFPFWNYTFVGGHNNIRLEYTYGFTAATRPREIRDMAAKITAIEIIQRKGDQISGGAINVSLDGVGRSFQGIPYGTRIERLETQIENIVRRYRRVGVG